MALHQVSSPVLFLIFNRPDTTGLVFEKIREARPSRLYIAADGPRKNKVDEEKLCYEARSIAEKVDWPCELKTLFREDNLGCKYAVSSAIDWFFNQEEQGIILEDDCLPSNDFFRLCDLLLEKYKDDTRITQIAGCNFQDGRKRGDASYYFSNSLEVWGWASWRRVWKMYDPELKNYDDDDARKAVSTLFNEPIVTEEYVSIFKELKAGKVDTWDYQLKFLSFFNNGLCIIPNANLISNIGFRADATHTLTPNDKFENLPLMPLENTISHPRSILPDKEADAHLQNIEFQIQERRKKKEKKFMSWLRRR